MVVLGVSLERILYREESEALNVYQEYYSGLSEVVEGIVEVLGAARENNIESERNEEEVEGRIREEELKADNNRIENENLREDHSEVAEKLRNNVSLVNRNKELLDRYGRDLDATEASIEWLEEVIS